MSSADNRVWDLLQTIDLENLDIATFQGVAAPIFAQKENKEALEALALIAFARMARQGEFNGWLNAGGGGGGGGWTTPATELYSDYDEFCTLYPFCGRTPTIANNGVNADQGYCYPFIARKTGTVTQMTIDVNSATAGLTSMNVSIYTDGGGYPQDIIGNGIFDCTTTGVKSVTSFTDEGGSPATISTTEDVVYWVVWGSTDTFTTATNKIGGTSYSNSSVGFLPERSSSAFANRPLVCRHISGGLATWSGVQASYVATDWQPYNSSNYGVPIGVYLQY